MAEEKKQAEKKQSWGDWFEQKIQKYVRPLLFSSSALAGTTAVFVHDRTFEAVHKVYHHDAEKANRQKSVTPEFPRDKSPAEEKRFFTDCAANNASVCVWDNDHTSKEIETRFANMLEALKAGGVDSVLLEIPQKHQARYNIHDPNVVNNSPVFQECKRLNLKIVCYDFEFTDAKAQAFWESPYYSDYLARGSTITMKEFKDKMAADPKMQEWYKDREAFYVERRNVDLKIKSFLEEKKASGEILRPVLEIGNAHTTNVRSFEGDYDKTNLRHHKDMDEYMAEVYGSCVSVSLEPSWRNLQDRLRPGQSYNHYAYQDYPEVQVDIVYNAAKMAWVMPGFIEGTNDERLVIARDFNKSSFKDNLRDELRNANIRAEVMNEGNFQPRENEDKHSQGITALAQAINGKDRGKFISGIELLVQHEKERMQNALKAIDKANLFEHGKTEHVERQNQYHKATMQRYGDSLKIMGCEEKEIQRIMADPPKAEKQANVGMNGIRVTAMQPGEEPRGPIARLGGEAVDRLAMAANRDQNKIFRR